MRKGGKERQNPLLRRKAVVLKLDPYGNKKNHRKLTLFIYMTPVLDVSEAEGRDDS